MTMREQFKDLVRKAGNAPQMTAVLFFGLAFACRYLWMNRSFDLASDAVFLVFSLLLSLQVICTLTRSRHFVLVREKVIAWLLLGAVFPLAVAPLPDSGGLLNARVCFLLISAAAVCFFNGFRASAYAAVPLTVDYLIIPFREYIMLYISHPMRLISTGVSVGLLQLAGVEVTSRLTTIHMPGIDIAVTDACSSIQQLEAMLLIGYLIVRSMHTDSRWALLHYLFLLPAVIIANTIRIMITILLLRRFGEVILTDVWHVSLGYFQVVLSILLLWWAGWFIRGANDFRRGSTPEKEVRP